SNPPPWRRRLATKRSDRSVSARTLRSIIASCSRRSSIAASPRSPKPAAFTAIAGSKPRAARSWARRAGGARLMGSSASPCGRLPRAVALSSASAISRASRRATSTHSCPCSANTWANAAPIPAEAPVINVTGLGVDATVLPVVPSCARPAARRPETAIEPQACCADKMRVIRGRKALITGAASGIGRAIALALAREGADLYLVDIDEKALAATARAGRLQGVEVATQICDLSEPAAISECVAALRTWSGALHILVNNAGRVYYGPTDQMTSAQWNALIAVNLLAPA